MRYFERRLRSAAYDAHYGDEKVIVKVPLEWLMQNITGSCDFGGMETFEDWSEMMSCKASDSGFGHLVESMMKRGFLRQGSIGIKRIVGEGYYITEGHHRLVASVLLGLDYVYVSRWGSSHYNTEKLPQFSAHSNHSDQRKYPDYPIEVEYT